MANFQQVDYSGPPTTYTPQIGAGIAVNAGNQDVSVYGNGYHDLPYLKEVLDALLGNAGTVYSKCEDTLAKFALVIDSTNTDLQSAHDLAYPEDTTPQSVTFDEYKYLLGKNTNNAAQYVISAYESYVRGPGGTNALDVSNMALMINNEAMRIKEFLDGFIGDVDATAEHRTLELFQDWAENASAAITGFWKTVAGSITQRIPDTELAQLNAQSAAQSQMLLRVKLNTVNQALANAIAKLSKNWETSASVFYAKNLGPALHFQLNAAKNLYGTINGHNMPVLGNEVAGTLTGLAANYSRALADQLQRNQLFSNSVHQVQLNIVQRDTYCTYINQLGNVSNKLPTNYFTDAASIDQSDTVLNADHPLSYSDIPNDYPANFVPNHAELAGLDDWNAHPQYLLLAGGLNSKIYGDILIEDGITVDGVDLDQHEHNGTDGSKKINGASILTNSITHEQIDITANTPVPFNLSAVDEIAITSPFGTSTVNVQIEFEISESNVSGYEFEIVELSS